MPQLAALAKRYDSKGLMVLGFHVQGDTEDNKKEIAQLIKKSKAKFPIFQGGSGPKPGGNGIPYAFVLDATGSTTFSGHPGAAAFDKAVRRAVASVTTKPAASPLAKPTADLVPSRAWKNADGNLIEAAIVSVDGDNVKFRKATGPAFTYSLGKLSAEDQAIVKAAQAKAAEPAPKP
jgi:hypothetical protein